MAIRRILKKPCRSCFKRCSARRNCGIWLKGPEFLRQAKEYWPARPVDLPPVDDDDPELKTVKLVNLITPHVNDCISTFIQHYSTWKRLIKATAWMIRYIMWKFSGKGSHPQPSCSFLTVKETDAASLDIVRFAQREVFPEVRNMLKDDDAFPNVTRQGSSIARTLCAN